MAKLRSELHQSFLPIATTFGVRLLSFAQALSFPGQGRPSKAALLDTDIVFTGFLLGSDRCADHPLAFISVLERRRFETAPQR